MPQPKNITVKFFALLREQANCRECALQTHSCSPAELYAELADARGLNVPAGLLTYAVNERYVSPDSALQDGDRVAFIPPVAGG